MRKTFIFIAQIAAIQHVTVIMATVWKPTSAWRSSGVGTNFVLGGPRCIGRGGPKQHYIITSNKINKLSLVRSQQVVLSSPGLR